MFACHRAAAALACSMWVAIPAHAQGKSAEYPTRPIRVVIGIAPGGGLDSITRVAAQRITERLGQTVVVDNRPGAGTVLGMDLVQQAPPDGYTLLCASETIILNGVLKRARYDVRTAFVPVVRLSTQPYILVANPSLPGTLKEVVALAKAKPGALSFGTPGIGTAIHIGWERLIAMTGINIVHVPYKGGAPAVLDLMSGEIHLVITTTITAGPHMKSGKLKAVAVTGPKRVSVYPEVPTVSESLPGYELTNSYAFFAPAGTSMAIVRKMNEIAIQAMNAPETRKVLAADGAEAAPPATPEEFKARFARDYAEMEKTIAGANIKLQ
jgi:tripartite-type tricarboxylate transporter receptor subunit TctC